MSDDDTTPATGPVRAAGGRLRRLLTSSVLVRFLAIALLVLAMQVPLAFVEGVVGERSLRHDAVRREIAQQ